jgi:hypothetical protein
MEIVLSEKVKKQGKILGETTELLIEITDVNNQKYEANVTLNKGWTQNELQNIVEKTYLLCDASPKAVRAIFLGVPVLH